MAATASQSAKVSDAFITSAISRVGTIPATAKANADKLVPVLRTHLKWLESPPAAHWVLFQQGTASDNEMFFLVAGALEVLEGTSVVSIMDAGQSFGEVCIGNPMGAKRTTTIRCDLLLTACCLPLSSWQLVNLLNKMPSQRRFGRRGAPDAQHRSVRRCSPHGA